ncbi:MAG: AAA family ATPase [Deltaproteobacteria bacterium]
MSKNIKKTQSESDIEKKLNIEIQNFEIDARLTEIYKHCFIETPFAERFQSFINDVRLKKKWAIVGAYARNGKSWCIKDLVKNSGAVKEYNGKTWVPVIAIRSPESSTPTDMISSLCRCFGKLPQSNTSALKKWLIENIPHLGVEQIIIDDAHELNLNHLRFIKWLTDTLELEKNYYLSIVLSSILGASGCISILQKIQQYRHEEWMEQVYERFSLSREVQGLSPNEVAQVLNAYEEIYKPFLPEIKLMKYTNNIFGWLTSTELDIHNSERVAMEHLSKLIYEAVRLACIEFKMKDIPITLLYHAFNVNLLNRDRLYSTENVPVYKPSPQKSDKNII